MHKRVVINRNLTGGHPDGNSTEMVQTPGVLFLCKVLLTYDIQIDGNLMLKDLMSLNKWQSISKSEITKAKSSKVSTEKPKHGR